MFHALVAGGIVFPGLFLLSKNGLKWLPWLRWEEADAVIVSARLVSSVQAIMASTVGYIVSSSCKHIIDDQHWLTSTYTQFAVPYFIYDIYAMFMCHWHKYRVKGHEAASGSAGTRSLRTVTRTYLRKEFLMVVHHLFMVLVCFPVSVLWRQGKGDFFLGCMLMAELSTPFVCLGKVLILSKVQWDRAGLICEGLIMKASEAGSFQKLIQATTHSSSQGERGNHAGDLLLLPDPALPIHVLGIRAVRRTALLPCALLHPC